MWARCYPHRQRPLGVVVRVDEMGFAPHPQSGLERPSPLRQRWPGTSSLVVPVPALEEWVRARSTFYDPAYVSSDPTFAHAHMTLLSPFVPADELADDVSSRVAEVLNRHRPFRVTLNRIAAFPDGIIHLVAEPAGPVRRITDDLVAAFPGYLPYAGRYGPVRPHVTLDRAAPGVDVATTRRSLGALLPASAAVDEVVLSWYEQDHCRPLARWPIGATAEP